MVFRVLGVGHVLLGPTLNDQGFSRLGSSAVSKVLSISLRVQVPNSSGTWLQGSGG